MLTLLLLVHTGKLLPRSVYDALETIVQSEYSLYLRDHELEPMSDVSEVTLLDEAFVDGENLTCQACGVSYQQETKHKYKLFRVSKEHFPFPITWIFLSETLELTQISPLSHKTLISIHDNLLPGENDFDQRSLVDPSDTYAISRTWSTSLKKYVEKKLNDLKSEPPKKKTNEAKAPKHSGAIDDLDLSEVMKNDDAKKESGTDEVEENNLPETSDSFKGEDPTSKISCK